MLACVASSTEQHPEARVVERRRAIEIDEQRVAPVQRDGAQQLIAKVRQRGEVDLAGDLQNWRVANEGERADEFHDRTRLPVPRELVGRGAATSGYGGSTAMVTVAVRTTSGSKAPISGTSVWSV